MKKISILLVLAVFISSAFAGKTNVKESDKSGESKAVCISGKIMDMKTNEELVGAIVQIEGTDISTYTDIDGTFSIENIQPGQYDIKVEYISYKNEEIEDLEVSANKDNKINIKLESL
mgnify:CR=1 FL=1